MNFERMGQFTNRLIAIDSVTPREAEKMKCIEQELQSRGLTTRRLPVCGERFNLLATMPGASPQLLFNTHVDTVAPRYGPHEDERRIYGRGACDTHGILAAFMEAFDVLVSGGLSGIGLVLTVDEEGGEHLGAACAGRDLPQPQFLIVGEPTENRLMRSQKGLLKADLIATGREGHSGYPERADDALERLTSAIHVLREQPWLARHSESGNTLNVFIKCGGEAYNKVPGHAEAGLFIRLCEPMNEVKSRVESAVRSIGDERLALRWLGGNDPVMNLATLRGWETGVAAYNTDIAHFRWPGAKTFLFGPGSIHQAHRDLSGERWDEGEWIDKAEQRRGAELYVRLVREALAEGRR